MVLGKIEYTKYIPPLKTHSKLKELERIWNLITKDPEWAVALQKRKIIRAHQRWYNVQRWLMYFNVSIFNSTHIYRPYIG